MRKDWTLKFGKYDFTQPDRIALDFAKKEGIPALSLAEFIRQKGLSARQIKPLFLGGSGHFTPAGHQSLADAPYESFYRTR